MKRLAVLLILLFVTACSSALPTPAATTPAATPAPTPQVPLQAAELPQPVLPRADFGAYRESVPPDAIPPIDEPAFVPADEAPLQDDELVMGVEIDLHARAYPVSVLRLRELVNDELGGIPILVSW